MDLVEDIAVSDARANMSPAQRWLFDHQLLATRIVPLAIVVGFISYGLYMWATGGLVVERVGLPGVWFFAFIGAASIFVPVPGIAAVCVAASPSIGLHPIAIGLVAGSAEALGEMTGYLAGMGGRGLVERNRFYPRFRNLLVRRGGLILFFGAIIPNPLLDLIGIAAGSTLYPIRKFLMYIYFAKTIKSIGLAYACLAGITLIQDLAS